MPLYVSLFLELKEDLGLNLSATKDRSLFLKCHISRNFLLYSSNSVFNFAWSILLAAGTKFKPLDSNKNSEAERFLLEKPLKFLQTNLPPSLTPTCEGVLIRFKVLTSSLQL